MRKVNWGNVEATSDGDFERLPAGPYVARITDMVDNEAKQYVELVWDVAEGPKAGFYSDRWGKELYSVKAPFHKKASLICTR